MTRYKHALVLASLENLALTVIRTLAAKGIKATIAGEGPGRMLRLSRHCSAYVRVGRSDAGLDRTARLARERGVDVVIPVDVPGGLFAASLRPRLPDVPFFPSAEPEALAVLDDKWRFYGLLLEQRLPAPRTWLLESSAQALGLPLPLVLKPLSEAGGVGVTVARDAAARDARLAGGVPHHRFPTLAQEYLDGEDVSMSFLADRGRLLAWSAHMHLRAGIGYVDDERVFAIGRRVAAATGYTGLANVDMRYVGPGRERVVALECNPRFWGTYKYTLGLGVGFLERGFALMEGRELPAFKRAPTGLVPGLGAAVRGLSLPPASRPYLEQKLGDPLPELYCGARALLGMRNTGP